MEEPELREALADLSTMVRDLGWDSLFDASFTPSDARTSDIDPRGEIRSLIRQLRRIVRDLSRLEGNFFSQDIEISNVSFKPDLAVELPQVSDGFSLARTDGESRRQVLTELELALSKLEDSV